MNRQFADDLDADLTRGHVLEWAELYALDAISTEERRTIEEYLDDADPTIASTFADRVRTCREAITSTYATDHVEPPADLFERIVARLPDSARGDTTSRSPLQLVDSSSTPPTDADATVSGAAAPTDELADRRTAKASLSSRASRWLVAAAAAVVLAVGGVTIAQNLQTSSLEDQVLQASDVRTERLSIGPTGTAALAVSGEENAAVVTLTGIPSPAEGYVYQMWRIPADGSSPVSVGTMTGEDVAGSKVTELSDISGFTAVAITVEPEGGSATPTLPVVAEIPLGA